MPRRISDEVAESEMRAVGAEPLEPYPGSHQRWKLRCLLCQREIVSRLHDVRGGHRPCGWCAGQNVEPEARAEIMREAGLEPLETYKTAWTKWKCLCTTCGAIVTPTYAGISQGEGGCRKCGRAAGGRKRRTPEDQAISTMRAAGVEPLVPYSGSHTPWQSQCLTCERTVAPALSAIQTGQSACRYCAGKAVDPQTAAEMMESARLEPLEPYLRSDGPWRCLCLACGQEVSPTYNSIKSGNGGCRFCAGLVVSEADAIQIARERRVEPLEPYPGANRHWRVRCLRCGEERLTRYATLRVSSGCKPCSMLEHVAKVLALGEAQAVKEMKKAGAIPIEPYPGTAPAWRSTCRKCAKEITPRLSSIRAGQGPCKYCAIKGIDLTSPAIVYLVTHEHLNAHKVGIGAPSGRRLEQHRKNGWQVYRFVLMDSGEEAFAVEGRVLTWLRMEKGYPAALDKEDMPQRGHTETVSADDISLPAIWRKIQSTINDVKKAP